MLLTAADVHRRDGYTNARRTLEALLRWGVVPVVNENDSTATDEIAFGDNDALAAQVALLLQARLLVLLTDVDGLYDRDPSDPQARPIAEVTDHALLRSLDVDGGRGELGLGRHALQAGRRRDGERRRHRRGDRRRGAAPERWRTPRPGAARARASAPTPARYRPTSCGSGTASR